MRIHQGHIGIEYPFLDLSVDNTFKPSNSRLINIGSRECCAIKCDQVINVVFEKIQRPVPKACFAARTEFIAARIFGAQIGIAKTGKVQFIDVGFEGATKIGQ